MISNDGVTGKKSGNGILTKVLCYIFLILLALVCIIPFYLMLVNATRTNTQIDYGVSLLPGTAVIENFKTLFLGRLDAETGMRGGGLNILRGFFNSAAIAVSATVLAGYFSALTAWGFSMYKFRGNKFLFGLILAVIMIPPTVSVIGFYKLIVNLGMYDTWWPLILPAIASPYTVFFLRQFIQSSFHPALLEAARIDGAKELYIFHKLGLPLITPAIATMSIFGFLSSWNNYLLPLTVLNSQKKYTLPLLIQMLNTTTYYRDQGALYAGVAISIIPIMIAFVFLSRYILGGLSFGAVKE